MPLFLQPIPEKMNLEMIIEMQIQIFDVVRF